MGVKDIVTFYLGLEVSLGRFTGAAGERCKMEERKSSVNHIGLFALLLRFRVKQSGSF